MGAAVQNIGANQFHKDCTTQASKKFKATKITIVITQEPILFITNKFKKRASLRIRTLID